MLTHTHHPSDRNHQIREIVLPQISDLVKRVISENEVQNLDPSSIKISDVIAVKDDPDHTIAKGYSSALSMLPDYSKIFLVTISYKSDSEQLSHILMKCVKNHHPRLLSKEYEIKDEKGEFFCSVSFPQVYAGDVNGSETTVNLIQKLTNQLLGKQQVISDPTRYLSFN